MLIGPDAIGPAEMPPVHVLEPTAQPTFIDVVLVSVV
jgi:hypothetical protein